MNEEQKIEFLLDLVSCINNEITTQQLIQKHPNWNVTNYSLSTKLPSLLWALFDKEAYITPKKISKELSYYIVDSVNRKLLPPKEKYQPTGKNVPTASVKNPPKFTNPPTNQNPPHVSPQSNLLGEKTHEVIFVFQLKICLNSTVYFVTCIELEIGLFFVQGLKEIINNSKVTVQMSTSNKNKLKFVARNSKGFSAMEETSFKQAFDFDVFKDDFFKSPGGINIFTLTPSFVNFTKRFKTEINAALKMNFITPSPETIRFQWNDIIPAFDTDIVDNCIKTGRKIHYFVSKLIVKAQQLCDYN